MGKRAVFTVGFPAWMTFVTIICLIRFPEEDTSGFDIPNLDKVVHFFLYFVATILGSFFLRERSRHGIGLGKALARIIFLVIIYGIIIEILQETCTSTRTGDMNDALANGIGALAAGGLIRLLYSGKRQLKW